MVIVCRGLFLGIQLIMGITCSETATGRDIKANEKRVLLIFWSVPAQSPPASLHLIPISRCNNFEHGSLLKSGCSVTRLSWSRGCLQCARVACGRKQGRTSTIPVGDVSQLHRREPGRLLPRCKLMPSHPVTVIYALNMPVTTRTIIPDSETIGSISFGIASVKL